MDGPLLVNDDGLHGMVEKCADKDLASGSHVVYIEGFQAGGGVGMVATYSGPDTGFRKILIRSASINRRSSLPSNLHRFKDTSVSFENEADHFPVSPERSVETRYRLMHQIMELTRRLKKQVFE